MSNVTATPAVKAKRLKRDPAEAHKKLAERIEKLKELLNKKQTELAVTKNPAVARLEKSIKAAKAKLAAANRFTVLANKKLKRLGEEVAETETRLKAYASDRESAMARIAEIEPKIEAAKAGVVSEPVASE